MKRIIERQLEQWAEQPIHRPLLVSGIRQCGKTYVIRAFGKSRYENVAYINFEASESFSSVFAHDFDVRRITTELGMLLQGTPIDPATTLIILDEIQECPRAITALKYFCEDPVDYQVICAGSLLGVEMKRKNVAFPVGKVDRLTMYPMNFYEFLMAADERKLYELAASYDMDRPLSDAVLSAMEEMLRLYRITGGMPYVVSRFLETRDYNVVDRELDALLQDFRDDFSKHADAKDIQKLSQIWSSVPGQLARDNQKFMFSHVGASVRARDLEDALQWLADAGLVYKLKKVAHPEYPVASCADDTFFKLYCADVGLLRRLSGIAYSALLTEVPGFSKMRGAITENYILTELVSTGFSPFYWRSGNIAEVDFLIEHETDIIPVEVKSSIHTQAKSLTMYCKKYAPRIAVKTSPKNVGLTDKNHTREIQIPLSLFWKLKTYLEAGQTESRISAVATL